MVIVQILERNILNINILKMTESPIWPSQQITYKNKCLIMVAMIVFATTFYSKAQSVSLGARFSPVVVSKAFVQNPSPAKIAGPKQNSLEADLYVINQITDHIGLKLSAGFGFVPWEFAINAPRSAFGTGDGQIFEAHSSNAYSYKSVGLSAIYNIPLKTDLIEVSAGLSLRRYTFGEDPDGFKTTYSGGSPGDIIVNINAVGNDIYPSMPVNVNYSIRTGRQTKLKIGVVRNIAFKPIADSELTVVMYNETFKGKFSPRTSFWGLNMQFEYSLTKLAEEKSEHKHIQKTPHLFRKSIFLEFSGTGIGFTGNFDMRFKPGQNDGFGFRAGIGSGYAYFSEDEDVLNRYLSLPLNLNYIIGKRRSGLEAGLGITPQFAFSQTTHGRQMPLQGFLNLGYRFQAIDKGVMFRTNWTPAISSDQIYARMFGLSLGYSFK